MPEDKEFPMDAEQPADDIEIEFLDQESESQEVEEKPEGLVEVPGETHEAEAEHLKTELDHVRDIYLRKLAEFDNFRKRVDREREEHRLAGVEDMVRDLLPVLDNFERALQHAEDDSGAFLQGVEMIAKQLWDTLEGRGVREVNPIVLKGYTMGDRLIRPAMVGVAVEPDGDSGDGGGGL
jgi:molecular chaperone GrpE